MTRRSAAEPRYVVIVDPSLGLDTLIPALDEEDVGLIILETERTTAFGEYFSSSDKLRAALRVQCAEADVAATVSKLRREYDVVLALAGDEGMLTAGETADSVVRGPLANDPATSARRRSKYAMNQVLGAHGLYAPRQHLFDLLTVDRARLAADLATFEFPLIFKPDECAGSVCTYKCETPRDIPSVIRAIEDERAGHTLSPVSRAFVAQEFVSGKEYLVDTYSRGGKHFVTGIFNYTKFMNHGVPIYQSVNYDGTADTEETVLRFVEEILDVLGNRSGLANTDLIRTGDRHALLEINCRIVGFRGWLSKLEKHLFGYHQGTLLAMDARDRLAALPALPAGRGRFGKLVMFQSRETRPMRPPNDRALRSLDSYVDHGWYLSEGDPLRSAKSLLKDTVGALLLVHGSKDALEEDYARVIDMQNEGALF